MRPLHKGCSPYYSIAHYSIALDPLEKTIGCYCSYCEMAINHVPEVEHRISKVRGGNPTDWGNLLLGCKYCNARKGTVIGDNTPERWLWPDKDNTHLAFTYDNGIPQLDTTYLSSCPLTVQKQAHNLFTDLHLDNIPKAPSDKDRRHLSRTNAYNRAKEYLSIWLRAKGTALRDDLLGIVCATAEDLGFFSVWMNVFQDEPTIRVALIRKIKGTAQDCYDSNGNPKPRDETE